MMRRRDCRCLHGMNKGTHFEKGAFFVGEGEMKGAGNQGCLSVKIQRGSNQVPMSFQWRQGADKGGIMGKKSLLRCVLLLKVTIKM